jgi:hypothetical protein
MKIIPQIILNLHLLFKLSGNNIVMSGGWTVTGDDKNVPCSVSEIK